MQIATKAEVTDSTDRDKHVGQLSRYLEEALGLQKDLGKVDFGKFVEEFLFYICNIH